MTKWAEAFVIGHFVAMEMVAATNGICYMGLTESHFQPASTAIAGIIAIAAIAYAFDMPMRFVERGMTL
ncbi:MAG: hypothetical protein ACRBM6_27185 [Geminicoccales bacterium]